MRELFRSTIIVPHCSKSVAKDIHIKAKDLKPTRIEYSFDCDDGKRKIILQTFGYDKVEVDGCYGCPFISDTELD